MVASLLGSLPVADSNILIAVGGTVAVIGIENVPVAVQAIAKYEVHRTINHCGVGISAVAIVGHLDTTTGVPVAKGDVTHDVHCCIGINANESNQQ